MSAAKGGSPSWTDRQGKRVFYTWTAQKNAAPMEIMGGHGARFETADGAEWIDFGSLTWNAHLGHGHPRMKQALAEAAGRGLLALPSSVFPDKARAGELLTEVAPSGLAQGKVFLCLSGAEANENAVKMARLVTGKRKIVYRDRSYHGATLAMLALSGDPRREPFEPIGIVDGVRWDDPYSATGGPGDLESVLDKAGDDVAAVLLEGVVGANGVYVPPPGYYRRIRELCDRRGVLLIADEVLSGFGRTGRWFALDHDGVSPDILTCAKALTGGYAPGGATVVSPRIAQHFDDQILSCGLTAYAHPLTCAAIVAAISILKEDKLVERAAGLGVALGARLDNFAKAHPQIAQVRGIGLLWALELGDAAGSSTPATGAQMRNLADGLRARHLHLHKRDHMVFIAPPLVATEADIDQGLAALGEALGAAW